MLKNIQKVCWSEKEKYQLLLAYRLNIPVREIAEVLRRSEKSVYRAIERFHIIGQGKRRGRPLARMQKHNVKDLDLLQLFRDCGLSSDPLFDKGFFVSSQGKLLYQPTTEVKEIWRNLGVSLDAPWMKKRPLRHIFMQGFSAKPTQHMKEYNLQDLLHFMQKSGNKVEKRFVNGQVLYVMEGQKHTPVTLLYTANKMRVQCGLDVMHIPGITQD